MGVQRREYQDRKTGNAVYYYAFRHEGQRYRKSGFRTRAEAQLAEQRARNTVILDRKLLHPKEYKQFDRVVEEFMQHRKFAVAPSTFDPEICKSRGLVRAFGTKRVDLLKASEVRGYVQKRKEQEIANRTVNLELMLLRLILDFAVQEGYALHNPARDVKNLPEVQSDHPMPPSERVVQLFEEASKTRTGLQLVVWLYVRFLSGLRPTESLWLKWSDFDFENDQIFVRPCEESPLKRRRFRVVEMHANLKVVLLEWRKQWMEITATVETKHEWVFIHPRHPEQRAKGFVTAFENARARAGLNEFRSYDMRHYFISEAVMAGVELMMVAKWSGHKSTKMIEEVYGHLAPRYRAEQMKKVSFPFPTLQQLPSGNGIPAERGKQRRRSSVRDIEPSPDS